MDKTLTWFIFIWIVLAVLLNIIAVAGMFMATATIWEGFGRVAETYSPFNVMNYVMELVLLFPAIAAFAWRQKRRGKTV